MFEPSGEVVDFIASYMNESHPDALREIAAAADFHADQVEITAMSSTELQLRGRSSDGPWRTASVAWPTPLRRREDIRRYLQQMQDDAHFR